ncbi:MAG: HAMP domain-containing protein [Chloroflexi bacterium]|nr:HAMP domain-containing protein [Chloroflexota bacterium]
MTERGNEQHHKVSIPTRIGIVARAAFWQIVNVFQGGSIQSQLLVAFVVMVLLPTTAVTITSAVVGWQSGRQQVIEQLELKATFKGEKVSAWIDSTQVNLTAALESVYIIHTRDFFQSPVGGAIHRSLRSNWSRYIIRTQQFNELFLLDIQGRTIVSTDDTQMDLVHSEQIYYQEGQKAPCAHLVYSSLLDRVVLAIAQPVFDKEGETLGVFVGYASMETLNEMVQEWTGLNETGKIYLVGSDHVMLTDSPFGGEEAILVHTWGADTAIENHTIGAGTYKDYRGVPVVGAFRWLSQLETVLLVEQDQSEAFRSIYTMVIINVGLALVSTIFAVVASLFVTRSIVAPMSSLAEVATRVAADDGSTQVIEILNPADYAGVMDRKDEIGVMAQAFTRMTVHLRGLLQSEREQYERLQTVVREYVTYMEQVGQGDLTFRLNLGEGEYGKKDDPLIVLGRSINRMVAAIQGILDQIRHAANNLSSTAAEIHASTTQQASGASEQSAAISQTTTTIEELETIAEQSVMRAQEVTGASQRTVEVSRTGRQVVQETIGSMGQIKTRVEGIAENILALSEQTQQIGEIITTVNDIAAQSNILALNASVEAARAGEYGKGFAVVAVEVRNLAEQSRQATAQVKAILSDIQKATNTTVMATEEGTKGVDEGVLLTAQVGEAIEQLAGVIEESAQAATQMVAGGRQQAAGVEQVAVAMQSINQATMQSLESTRQTEKAARDMSDLARSLTEIVEQYQL